MIGLPHLANFLVTFVARVVSVAIVRLRLSLLGVSNFTQMRTFLRPMSNTRYTKGFTLLELVMVVAIVAILAGIIISSFSGFRNSKVLDTASEESLALLSEARGSTLAGKDGYQYGVHLDAGQMVMYRGATYTNGDVNNKVSTLDSALEIVNITLTGGGSNILFDRITGKTVQPGTFVIRIKSDTAKTRTMTVNGTGVVSGS